MPTSAISPASRRRLLNVALWIAQLLLAAAFGLAGVIKSTNAMAELAVTMGWPADVPAPLVRFIGASELAAAIGLVLPAATRVRPLLTPLAAIGLVTIMACAVVFHASRGEWAALPVNLMLAALAAFVAWGRLRRVPIPAR